ncbi:MAG: hypothetical protein HZB50_13860 [Chloroflexi bacterium]|nr:hypothetical protein [Chloroflexota bacterium]
MLKIRNAESAFREGSLELISNFPKEVLGYKRNLGSDEFVVLLNFGMKDTAFDFEQECCIFKLSEKDDINNNRVLLSGYGGMILKTTK